MQFEQRLWAGLADGSVTVAVRRWKRPSVKTGGTLKSPGGVLAIDEVARIELADVTGADARAAGFADRDAVIAALRPEGELYRIRFHRIGDDPRISLRATAALDPDDVTMLTEKLRRLDWAVPILVLIRDNPAVVSTVLAARMGMERLPRSE